MWLFKRFGLLTEKDTKDFSVISKSWLNLELADIVTRYRRKDGRIISNLIERDVDGIPGKQIKYTANLWVDMDSKYIYNLTKNIPEDTKNKIIENIIIPALPKFFIDDLWEKNYIYRNSKLRELRELNLDQSEESFVYENENLIIKEFFNDKKESKIEEEFHGALHALEYGKATVLGLFLVGLGTKEILENLTYDDLIKWADSYGYTEEKKQIKNMIKLPNVLSSIVFKFIESRKTIIDFILSQQTDLLNKIVNYYNNSDLSKNETLLFLNYYNFLIKNEFIS